MGRRQRRRIDSLSEVDLDLLDKQLAEIPAEVLLCRDLGHQPIPHRVQDHRDGSKTRFLRCRNNCGVSWVQELDSWYIPRGPRKPIYPDHYLFKGTGRLDAHARGYLRGMAMSTVSVPHLRAVE